MPDSDTVSESSTDSPVQPAPPSRFRRIAKFLVLSLAFAWLILVFWNSAKPLPPGTHVVSQTSRLSESDVDFLFEQPPQPGVLARELSAIDHAEQLIVLDRSPVGAEEARHLLARKRLRPTLRIVLVTDPGGAILDAAFRPILDSLERAGVIVARVRLDRLRDSNPLYTGLWRLMFGWWSDPFDETPGEISVAAWARSQNFKADQRQLMIADDGSGGWTAVIGPAGAAAGLVLRGSLARAMLASELPIAAWSTDDDRLPPVPPMSGRGVGSIDTRFLTEGAIKTALLDAIAAAGRDDQISIAVKDLSDRPLITAALRAATRGAHLQVMLARNQIPNQVVAGELQRDGSGRIEVRWYPIDPAGSAPKLLIVRHRTDLVMSWSSANFTRRNLDDLNLEAGVELRMLAQSAPARAVTDYFAKAWSEATVDTAEESIATYWHYRLAEATGLSSF